MKRFLRFAAVGVCNVAIDTGVYLLLVHVGLQFVLSNFVSTTCGLIFSFFANRSFTFQAKGAASMKKQALRFFVIVGIGIWIIQPLVIAVISTLLQTSGMAPLLIEIGAKLIAIAIALVWNYIWFALFVFKPDNTTVNDE